MHLLYGSTFCDAQQITTGCSFIEKEILRTRGPHLDAWLLQEMGMGGQLWDRESAMQEVAKGELGDDYGEQIYPCHVSNTIMLGPQNFQHGLGRLLASARIQQILLNTIVLHVWKPNLYHTSFTGTLMC